MKEKIKHIFLQTFATHIGRILFGALLSLVGGIMTPSGTIGELIYNYDEGGFWKVLFYIGMALVVGEGLLFIVYGIIINPIKSLIKKIKNK
jgi:hypothetical protein